MNDTTTASAPSAPRRRKKSRGGLILTLLVLVTAGGSYGVYKYLHRGDSQDVYQFGQVTVGDIEDLVTSTGKLQPRDYVDVGAQVSGQILKLYVEVGDTVEKGDPLAEIDATTAIAKVDSLKAQLLNAETNLKTQETNKEKAARDLKRQENLYAAGAATKETVLNATTTFANAERSIISSTAQIEIQKANLRIEEKNLGYTKIVAPIAGTVMSIKVKEGQTVNASQNVPNVLQIANLTTMIVQTDVSEADMGKVHVGMPVYFTTLSGGNRRWYSELKRIEPTPKEQNSVVLYNALFEVQNEGETLRPSMTTQVYFVSAEAKETVRVPMAALQQGAQIARELANKNAAKKDADKQGGAAKTAGAPGAGAPGGAPGPAPDTAATSAGAPAAAGTTGSAAAKTDAAPSGQARTAGAPGASANGQGNRPNGMGGGAPGSARGPGGGGMGGAAGGARGNFTPEQIEQMRRNRQAGGQGGAGGPPGGSSNGGQGMRAGGGGQGGFNGGQGMRAGGGGQSGFTGGQGMRGGGGQGFSGPRLGGSNVMASMGGAGGGAARPVSQRRGTVMVRKADNTLEERPVVVGITDRVLGQVISGLKEGEWVVTGKKEKEAPSAATPRNNNNNNNNFNQGNRGGNFPGGGRPF